MTNELTGRLLHELDSKCEKETLVRCETAVLKKRFPGSLLRGLNIDGCLDVFCFLPYDEVVFRLPTQFRQNFYTPLRRVFVQQKPARRIR